MDTKRKPVKQLVPFFARFLERPESTRGMPPTNPTKDYLRPHDPSA